MLPGLCQSNEKSFSSPTKQHGGRRPTPQKRGVCCNYQLGCHQPTAPAPSPRCFGPGSAGMPQVAPARPRRAVLRQPVSHSSSGPHRPPGTAAPRLVLGVASHGSRTTGTKAAQPHRPGHHDAGHPGSNRRANPLAPGGLRPWASCLGPNEIQAIAPPDTNHAPCFIGVGYPGPGTTRTFAARPPDPVHLDADQPRNQGLAKQLTGERAAVFCLGLRTPRAPGQRPVGHRPLFSPDPGTAQTKLWLPSSP